MNIASSLCSGTLPSNTITNPKEDLKGITTRSGIAYKGPTIPTTSFPPKVVERKTEVTKDTVPPTNNRSTKDVQPSVVQVKTQVPNSKPVVAPVVEPVEAPVNALKPKPKSSIPYLSRLHDQKLREKANDQMEKIFQIFQDLNFNISFANALILMPECSKQRIEDFNLEEISPPIVTMADQRTMAQLLQAHTEGYEDAIVVPAITAGNFELKQGLLTLVQNKQFFGHDKEDPHAHGVARIWLEKEPPRSIFTWDDLVLKFINQFFSSSKTTNLHNEITNFQQRFDESFSEACDRFKDILRTYPYHGFSELHQLDTFYNALNLKDQDSLNSATGGNFLDKIPREFLAIIKSKSKVRYSRNKPVVAKVSMNTSTFGISPDVFELKDMVKTLLLDKQSQNQSPAPVKAVEESFNYNQGNTSYRPPMMSNQIRPPGPVYQPPIFQPPSYQAPTYQAPAPQTQGVSKEDFSAYVKANDAVIRNMQTQGQNMQNQLTNLTDLITKFVNSNSAFTLSSGTLPRNTIANPRSDLKSITTQSGVSYDGPQIPPLTSFLPKVVENEPEATKDIVNPTNNRSTEDVQPQVVQSKSLILTSEPVTSPISEPVIALLSEMARTPLNEHCSAVLLKKIPKKLGDPGKFLIPCDFPELVNHSISRLVGVVEDAYVKVGSFHFSADFVVVDFDADPRVPLILGRSFLKTGKALIDVFEGELTLRVGKESITFNLDQTSRYSANYSDMTAKRIDVIDMACEDDFLFEEVDAFLAIEVEPTSSEFFHLYLDPEGDILLLEAVLNDDPSLPPPNQGNYLPDVRKELKICETKSDRSSVDEPPKVELKDLPPHLEYAFLEGDEKLPVIIAKNLSVDEKTALIMVLKSHKRAIAWKLSDIKGINPEFCTHKILMEKDFEPAVQHQRRVNLKIHDVIKQEVIKLLKAGLIYPIYDSPWVSPVHCVPKKGGFTVVENDDNELILNRLVTSRRVCIDYRKFNEATRKDHFPLPFMDQMLKRLAGNQYYCFLDGFSSYFKIPIDSKDQEKTTFTCPYEMFAYRHMPFRLCNAPGTFQRQSNDPASRKDTLFHFSKECVEAFQTLKRNLTEALILIAPDWDMPFELICDASDFAIDAVLGQR
uniref:Reverse transcriptase domain-containing protein n=1 Tax=Tanacetum cinerariifolium TaxID=118510 RepID=A0A6L2P0D7_TANCI|nr:reverse transcriptase domain-containing protein [Tanacetum cinerariifolium]